jgi:5-(aminomethyl)-3-furanmethanol phosphate kinase
MNDLKGFVNYKINAVVKFGGSLLEKTSDLKPCVDALAKCSTLGLNLLVIPGGGPTDNTIEKLDKKHPFAPDTHHYACARAQDQTGLMICDPVFGASLRACQTLEEVQKVLREKQVPVLLPSKVIFDIDPFERTWEITSDAMAAWFSWLVSAPIVVILTNVDGIYPPSSLDYNGSPISEITASELVELGHTAVDACTAPFLKFHNIEGWVINGCYPERLYKALSGEEVIGTHILPT